MQIIYCRAVGMNVLRETEIVVSGYFIPTYCKKVCELHRIQNYFSHFHEVLN